MNADTVKTILEIVLIVVGAFGVVFVYLKLTPNLSLSISPQWTTGIDDFCVLRLTIENKSNVRLKKESILLAITEHELSDHSQLSEMVNFSSASEICKPTQYIYPSKILVVDWLLHFPSSEKVKHVGLQVNGIRPRWASLANLEFKRHRHWTTTAFVLKPIGQSIVDGTPHNNRMQETSG